MFKVSLFLMALPTIALAEASPVTAIRGIGATECQDFMQAVLFNTPQEALYGQWFAGYTTGASIANGVVDAYPIPDGVQLLDNVFLVCKEAQARGLEAYRIDQALPVVLERARPFWPKNASDTLIIKDEAGNQMPVYQDSVKPLQAAIVKAGYQMPQDGDFGPKSSDAFKRLHLKIGVSPIGVPTGGAIYALTRPDDAPEM